MFHISLTVSKKAVNGQFRNQTGYVQYFVLNYGIYVGSKGARLRIRHIVIRP